MRATLVRLLFFFFFNDTATTEIYTLSLHDALPISATTPGIHLRLRVCITTGWAACSRSKSGCGAVCGKRCTRRSEEHTSELQSRLHLVCRLLLEKKKKRKNVKHHPEGKIKMT